MTIKLQEVQFRAEQLGIRLSHLFELMKTPKLQEDSVTLTAIADVLEFIADTPNAYINAEGMEAISKRVDDIFASFKTWAISLIDPGEFFDDGLNEIMF